MYKLIVLLMLLVECSFVNKSQAQHVYVLVDKTDTVTAIIRKNVDTIRFKITVRHRNTKLVYNYIIIEQLKNKRSPFLFIDKDINGKIYKLQLRDSLYYTTKNGNRKNAFFKMISERTAFILNGIKTFKCFTIYKLQKNSYDGILKITYSPDFGLLNLYLNTYGEETKVDGALSANFALKSVDGQNARDYLKSFCGKK